MVTPSLKISVVTTFNQQGLCQYAQRMIDGFAENWPKDIDLIIYAEDCIPHIPAQTNMILRDLNTVDELKEFKAKWKNIPKANGDVGDDPIRSKRKDAGKGFKWNAIRFAHKVYAIFDCARNTDADILLWMDADTVCHTPISIDDLKRLIPTDKDLCYLGRKGKYSECGLYALNLKSDQTKIFLMEFQRMYDNAESGIFTLEEWHDSFVFDAVRNRMPFLKQLDWAVHLHDLRPVPGMSTGEGHPLINSEWGAYLDHLKGDRKSVGRSLPKDLKVRRTETYWQ